MCSKWSAEDIRPANESKELPTLLAFGAVIKKEFAFHPRWSRWNSFRGVAGLRQRTLTTNHLEWCFSIFVGKRPSRGERAHTEETLRHVVSPSERRKLRRVRGEKIFELIGRESTLE